MLSRNTSTVHSCEDEVCNLDIFCYISKQVSNWSENAISTTESQFLNYKESYVFVSWTSGLSVWSSKTQLMMLWQQFWARTVTLLLKWRIYQILVQKDIFLLLTLKTEKNCSEYDVTCELNNTPPTDSLILINWYVKKQNGCATLNI